MDVVGGMQEMRRELDILQQELPDSPVEEMGVGQLVNLYILLSDVESQIDDIRKEVRDEIIEELGPDTSMETQYGSISTYTREYQSLRDEDEVVGKLERHGINRDSVMSLDETKVSDAVDAVEMDVEEVFEVTTREMVRRNATNRDGILGSDLR